MTTDMEMLRETFEDPARFGEVALRHKYWPVQKQIMRSVRDFPRTAVKACHASGKSYVAADLALFWLARYIDGIVITTAPTAVQVERILWGNIREAAKSLYVPSWRINLTDIRISAQNYAIGISTDEAERFQGWHGNVLIIVDEASGIRKALYNAIEGIRAGGNIKLLLLGNPTIAGGYYYDSFQPHTVGWKTFTIDAFDTPNLHGMTLEQLLALPEHELDHNEWPQLTARRWVYEKYYDWGVDNPEWQSRVMGEFPTQSQWSVYPLHLLQWAEANTGVVGEGRLIGGLDIAGAGRDETALCLWNMDTGAIEFMDGWSDSDPRGSIIQALEPFRSRLLVINGDESGIGHYMLSHLADYDIPVSRVNVGTAPLNKQRFALLKDEIYWHFRQRLENHEITGFVDRTCIGQAIATNYAIDAHGKTRVEDKATLRKRGIPSPDRLESLILATMPVDVNAFKPVEQTTFRAFRPAASTRQFRIG